MRAELDKHLASAAPHGSAAVAAGQPTVFALVETGARPISPPQSWLCQQVQGRKDKSTNHQQSGGVCILTHMSCPFESFTHVP